MRAGFHKFWLVYTLMAGLMLGKAAAANANKDQVSLLERLDELRRENRVSAIGLALVENGQVTFTGGLGSLRHGESRPVTQDSIFRVGSVTKSFTALALVSLARTREVSLDKPFADIAAPSFNNAWSANSPVTLAQLLEHTAGFTGISKAEFDFNDPGDVPLASTLARYGSRHKTAWPPGRFHSYSNLGYAYAGRAIERLSGLAYEDYLQQTVLSPLAMHDSGFFVSADERGRLVAGYDRDGVTPIPYWHMVYRPFGGLNTTPRDMARFLRTLIGDGVLDGTRVVREAVIQRTRQPQTSLAAPARLASGYGAGAYSWFRGGTRFYGHGGDADGYLSRYGYTQRNASGYFLVVNAFNSAALNAMRQAVESYLIRDLPAVAVPAIHALNQPQITALLGDYLPQTRRFGDVGDGRKLTIIREDSRLYTVVGNRKRPLIPVSDRRFRRPGQPLATSTIVDDDGERYFIGPEGAFLHMDRER